MLINTFSLSLYALWQCHYGRTGQKHYNVAYHVRNDDGGGGGIFNAACNGWWTDLRLGLLEWCFAVINYSVKMPCKGAGYERKPARTEWNETEIKPWNELFQNCFRSLTRWKIKRLSHVKYRSEWKKFIERLKTYKCMLNLPRFAEN